MVEQPEGRIPTLLDPLIPSEIEVLQLAADGWFNEAIATQLHLAVNTVNQRFSNIYEKLGLNISISGKGGSRAKAVADGIRLGLIQ